MSWVGQVFVPAMLLAPLAFVLGMGVFVIALAGFGYQVSRAWNNPSPTTLAATVIMLGIPLTLAWIINRALRERAAG